MANLVIVESPSKAAAIKKYLGSNYKVIASKGHVRDLPKSSLSVDIDNNFEAHYINIRGKGDLIREIRKEAKAARKSEKSFGWGPLHCYLRRSPITAFTTCWYSRSIK